MVKYGVETCVTTIFSHGHELSGHGHGHGHDHNYEKYMNFEKLTVADIRYSPSK